MFAEAAYRQHGVDLRGFQRFIDAVGGIEIDVKKRTPIGGGTSPIRGWIEPGRQRLDGYHALWYARSGRAAATTSGWPGSAASSPRWCTS